MCESKIRVFIHIILILADMGSYKSSLALPPQKIRNSPLQGTASKNSAPFPNFQPPHIYSGAVPTNLLPKVLSAGNSHELNNKNSGSLIMQNKPNYGSANSRALTSSSNKQFGQQKMEGLQNIGPSRSSHSRSMKTQLNLIPPTPQRYMPTSSNPFDQVATGPLFKSHTRRTQPSTDPFDQVIMGPLTATTTGLSRASSDRNSQVNLGPIVPTKEGNFHKSLNPFSQVSFTPQKSQNTGSTLTSRNRGVQFNLNPRQRSNTRNEFPSRNREASGSFNSRQQTTSTDVHSPQFWEAVVNMNPNKPSNAMNLSPPRNRQPSNLNPPSISTAKLNSQSVSSLNPNLNKDAMDTLSTGNQESETNLSSNKGNTAMHAVASHSKSPSSSSTSPQASEAANGVPQRIAAPASSANIGKNLKQDDKTIELGTKNYRQVQKKCALKINEVYAGQPNKQFIEIASYCPIGVDQKPYGSMIGYYVLMAAKESDGVRIFLLADLENQYLQAPTTQNNVQILGLGSKTILNIGLRFGKEDIKQDRFRRLQYANYPDEENIIPQGEILIFLVFIAPVDKSRFRNLIKLPSTVYENKETYVSLPFCELLKLELRNKIIDYMIIGNMDHSPMQQIVQDIQGVAYTKEIYLQHVVDISPGKHLSYSLCFDKTTSEFIIQHLKPTPMKENNCPLVRNFPYEMKYLLQRESKKIIMNLLHGLMHAVKDPEILKGSPIEVASKLIGINTRKLQRIQTMGDLCLKERKKVTPKNWKQSQIDSFDRDKIRSIIAESFRKNVAPLFQDVFKEFLDYKSSSITYTTNTEVKSIERFLPYGTSKETIEEIEKISSISKTADISHTSSEPGPKTVVIPAEKFSINSKTFAKVLYDLGFHYGLVNQRVCLLQRSDLVEWRGSFVKTMMENERSPNRRKVTWLDETWIDPHIKATRGWTLKNPQSNAECAKYSFRNLKVGKGPRLIVLAAGDEDGIIPESIKIRKISQADVDEDYHKNVNKEEFMRWFNGLLDTLDKRNEKHIIVIDNAPYHSALIAPKSTARKGTLVDWFAKLRTMPDIGVHIPDTTGLNRKQLWEEVTKLKKNPRLGELVYEIDEIAAKRGHLIVRLPPYHCMFNPIEFYWKDGKQEIAKQNAHQNINELMSIAETVFKSYKPETWKKHVQHCKNLQAQYWKEDKYVEPSTEPFIIPLNVGDEDDFSENDDDDEESCGFDNSDCLDTFDFDPTEIEEELNQGRQEVLAFQESMLPLEFSEPSRKKCKRSFIFPLDI